MSPQPEIIEKIKKLLALSKSSNVHEAANAAAVANKYIVQYRLKEADLIEQQTQDKNNNQEYYPEPIHDDPEPAYESARVTIWKVDLLCLLAHHYGCAVWNDKAYGASKSGRNVSRFRLVGRFNDIKFAKYMFSWLVGEIQRHADVECRGQGHIVSGSYCKGAVRGVEDLLRSTREQQSTLALQAGKSKALAKVNNREQEAQDYMRRKHHLLQPTARKPKFDSNAFERGFDVGNYLGKSSVSNDE